MLHSKLKDLKRLIASTWYVFAITACGPSASSSFVSGHFEGSTDLDLTPFKSKQTVVPEYYPSQSVLISSKLLTEHHQEELVKSLVNSDIDRVWITVPEDYSHEQEAVDFRPLYDLLKDDRSKVFLLKQPLAGQQREWARDFAPWTARTKEGQLRLLDFNYYPSRPSDDSVPTALAQEMKLTRLSLPIYIEGGNFMVNQAGTCMMTDKVLEANSTREVESDLIFSRNEIVDYFQDYAGCKKVLIFPSMPFEGTRHIDLWAKLLDDETILVSEISDAIENLPAYSAIEKRRVTEVKQFLDDRASDLIAAGFTILRVPMPAPFFAADGYNLFRSYTNSLALNGRAFLPRYRVPANELDGIDGKYIDADYTEAYEASVQSAYRNMGYEVHWIDSDSTIAKGGAVHCTIMQIAR